MVFVGSKEEDVVLVVRRDAEEAIGSESDILYAVKKTRMGSMGMDLVRYLRYVREFLCLKDVGAQRLIRTSGAAQYSSVP